MSLSATVVLSIYPTMVYTVRKIKRDYDKAAQLDNSKSFIPPLAPIVEFRK